MKKYTYHRESYELYHRRRGNAVIIASICIVLIVVLPWIGINAPDLADLVRGRIAGNEQLGAMLFIGASFVIVACLLDLLTAGRTAQRIEMYELEICDKHILATYPSSQNGNTTPEKKFLQIPYDEIAKVDFQREYTRGQKVNFTIYHKSGCVELCIENPEEAAYDIDECIKKVKGIKKEFGQESCDQKVFTKNDEYEENELSDEGDPLTPTIPKENENFFQNQIKCICPHCRKEFFVFKGAKRFVCPYCEKQIEFFSIK